MKFVFKLYKKNPNILNYVGKIFDWRGHISVWWESGGREEGEGISFWQHGRSHSHPSNKKTKQNKTKQKTFSTLLIIILVSFTSLLRLCLIHLLTHFICFLHLCILCSLLRTWRHVCASDTTTFYTNCFLWGRCTVFVVISTTYRLNVNLDTILYLNQKMCR